MNVVPFTCEECGARFHEVDGGVCQVCQRLLCRHHLPIRRGGSICDRCRASSKKRYQTLVEAVTKAIDLTDPIGLLEMDAPSDEYSNEIARIVPKVTSATSESQVATILFEEFTAQCGAYMAGPMEQYESLATSVWQAVLAYRATK